MVDYVVASVMGQSCLLVYLFFDNFIVASGIRKTVSTFRDDSQTMLSYDQATKGVWWMPWRWETMKDVVSCDKLRVAANKL